MYYIEDGVIGVRKQQNVYDVSPCVGDVFRVYDLKGNL
jgi:hypothetical protein